MTDPGSVNREAFCGSNVRRFILYMAAIGLCLAAILYMLLHAKPAITPAVKDGGGDPSSLSSPAVLPSSYLPSPSLPFSSFVLSGKESATAQDRNG